MKFIRPVLICAALAIALAALLAGAAFVPAVQTWIAQQVLAEHPDLRGSLGSLSAGLGEVDVADLRIDVGDAVLTLPSLQARLPLAIAARDRRVLVRSLVAKGWTLDVSGIPELRRLAAAASAGNEAVPLAPAAAAVAQETARLFHRLLSGGPLPCEVSLDGVDLEGDILIAAPTGRGSAKVHVVIRGGGLAAGGMGSFSIDASSVFLSPELSVTTVGWRGRLAVGMPSPRVLDRVEFKADFSAKGGPMPEGYAGSIDFGAARGAGGESYALDVKRGGRRLAGIAARLSDGAQKLAGTWRLDVRDSDAAVFAPDRPLPSFAVAGDGRFDLDASLARVHAAGRLNAVLGRLGVLAPALEGLGTLTLNAGFEATRSGRSIQVDRLGVSLAGARPIAVVQALQPFAFDSGTGDLKAADPAADLLKISIDGFPLAWLPALGGGWAFGGGVASGAYVVRAEKEGLALLPKGPLAAAAVSVRRGDSVFARNLDLTLRLGADYTPDRWRIPEASLTVASGGRLLAKIDARASRQAGQDQPIAVRGTWSADLETLARGPAIPGLGWIAGRSASGTFSASLGPSAEIEASLAAVGRDPGRSIAASVRATVDPGGTVSFLAPAKIADGSGESEVSAEGTWTRGDAGGRLDIRLTGKEVALDHLRMLAAPLAAAAGPAGPSRGRDRLPFWGDWVGSVAFDFDRLETGSRDFEDVGGTLYVDPASIRLEGGQSGLAPRGLATAEGALAFDAAAERPYRLKVAFAVAEVEAAPLFAAPQDKGDPVVEGRFAVAGTLAGDGANLRDLARRAQEQFRLTSTAGIVRVLKTSVADSIPEVDTPVKDALGTAGSFVGSLFGVRKSQEASGKNPVGKTAEAVLDFTYQVAEIGYDQVAVTAVRESDGSIRLVDLAMTAPDERLTGTGRIAGARGLALGERPISVDLRFWARGQIAQLLSTAGLLSSQKDAQGYAMLIQPIHLGGTLEHIDQGQWHALLAKAAAQKPEGAKKGG